MKKNEALNILLAHACCASSNICEKCPFDGVKNCAEVRLTEVLEKAVDVMSRYSKVKTMLLSDIKVTSAFADSVPKEEKMNKCRNYWIAHNKQDRYLVVNQDGYLMDGYIQYLVLKENNIEYAKVKISNRINNNYHDKRTYDSETPRYNYRTEPTAYVYGIHPREVERKERVWRVPKSWMSFAENVRVGDSIKCRVKHGVAPVIVTRIDVSDQCPVDFMVKRVSSKKIIRNGQAIEC